MEVFGTHGKSSTLAFNRGIGPIFLHTNEKIDVAQLADEISRQSAAHAVKNEGPQPFKFYRVTGEQSSGAGLNFVAERTTESALPPATYTIAEKFKMKSRVAKFHDVGSSAPVVSPTRVRTLLGDTTLASTLAIEVPKTQAHRAVPLAYLMSKIIASRPGAILVLARVDKNGDQLAELFTEDRRLESQLQKMHSSGSRLEETDRAAAKNAAELPTLLNEMRGQETKAIGYIQANQAMLDLGNQSQLAIADHLMRLNAMMDATELARRPQPQAGTERPGQNETPHDFRSDVRANDSSSDSE